MRLRKLVLLVTFVSTLFAVTRIDLTQNVRGILPRANGGALYASQYVNLAAADGVAVSNNVPICLDANFILASDTTLNGKWRACGGIIIRGSHNLTFNQMPDLDDVQSFDASGTGTVKFVGHAKPVRATWFGLSYDGLTDNTNAIQQAGNSAIASGVGLIVPGGQGNIYVHGALIFSGLLGFNGDNPFAGTNVYQANTGSFMYTDYTAGPLLTLDNAIGADYGGFGIRYINNTAGITTAVAVEIPNVRRSSIHNINVFGAANCLDNTIGSSAFYSNSVRDIICALPTNIPLNLAQASGASTGNNYDNIYIYCGGSGSGSLTGATTIQNAVFLSAANEVKFRQLNIEWCNITQAPVFIKSDVTQASFDGLHLEGDELFANTSDAGSQQGFVTIRSATGSVPNVSIDNMSVINTKLYWSNFSNSHYAVVEVTGANGAATVDLKKLYWNGNWGTTGQGDWVSIFNFYENGGASAGHATLGDVTGDRVLLNTTHPALGNWVVSPYKDYLQNDVIPGVLGSQLPNTLGCIDGYDHLPCTVGVGTKTAQTGNVSNTTVLASAPAGVYAIAETLRATTAATGGTVSINTVFTTYNGVSRTNQAVNASASITTTTSSSQGNATIKVDAGTNIQYAVTLNSVTGSPVYDVDVVVMRLK